MGEVDESGEPERAQSMLCVTAAAAEAARTAERSAPKFGGDSWNWPSAQSGHELGGVAEAHAASGR